MGKLMEEVLPSQLCAVGGMLASTYAVGEVSTAAATRMSSEVIGWAGWPGATGAVEGGAEEAWAGTDGEA